MFRLALSNPNGFGASGRGDLSPPPPTTLTEAFVAAHTDVVPDPAGTTTDGSITTTNATDATEAPTFQALFTQNTYPE
jgi:hypothetical protein